jgi:glycolate oxidase iron-sulfur subunit
VACGLCLPHCPTYCKTLNEADSPRGRIMLMSAVMEGVLPANPRFMAHLDQCLTCRACENICPNNVAYGRLVAQVRNAAEPLRHRSPWGRFMRRVALGGVVSSRRGLILAARALRLWEIVGGRSLLAGLGKYRIFPRLLRWSEQLPRHISVASWQAVYPAIGPERSRVALFLGCVARAFDNETLRATVYVLNRLGCTVDVPDRQNCCGALHVGQGDLNKAQALALGNLEAFPAENWDAVIVTATGCGAALREYPQLMGAEAKRFAIKVAEIGEFISAEALWRGIEIRPLNEKIAVHEPCSLRNILHGQSALYRLLNRIPGAECVELGDNDRCCGAGGAYQLSQPEMSALLLADKVAAMKESGASIIASSNFGCAQHLAVGARQAGLTVEVVHPIVLLARQMGFGD